MNHHYSDIRSRIAEPPVWFDENAVPRWCEFGPNEGANIYADEIALLHIECQNCGAAFRVAMSWTTTDRIVHRLAPLSARVRDQSIHYGDPPNVGCCPSGPTMNSVPRRVLEFWRRECGDGVRAPELEIAIEPDWFAEEDR